MLVDSHCHLDYDDYADELDAVVARAGQVGVDLMVTICTRVSQFEPVLAVAERFDNIYCSVGVHPHHVEEEGVVEMARLVEMAAHPKVVGIGETGLDYHYDRSPRDLQRDSFRAHIEAARQTGLPVIVHSRNADQDTAAILAESCADGGVRGVMHCFSSSRQLAEKAVDLGFYVSLAGIVTFKNAEELRQTVRDLPSERLLVETDAPYLAPVPMRGKRNEPAFVTHTAAVVAELKGMPTDAFGDLSTGNFLALFDKVPRPEDACV
jgi:TatD DNase family protein